MNIVNGILITIGLLFVSAVVLVIVRKRVPRKLKTAIFAAKWRELQGYCKDKALWPQALADADQLLDNALRRRKYKGKSMGERMVSAQRTITNNDAMWFAHNLYKKVAADASYTLKEADVKAALVGYRSALKDIGALPSAKPEADTTSGKDMTQ